MRISDWSSDVCSSDLQFQGAVREAVRIPVAMSPLLQLPVIGAAIAPGRAIGIITADSGNLTTEFMAQEIGRASCRERVCAYVWISVVAVSLKKKKTISVYILRSKSPTHN